MLDEFDRPNNAYDIKKFDKLEGDTFIGCDTPFEDAEICLFGAAFDSTTSFRPGARFAPGSMRRDSWGLETYSPRQDADMEEIRVCDLGDPTLAIGNTEAALSKIEDTADAVLAAGKVPVMIGGEHLVTLGSVRACYKKYGDELRIVHFDAHADLRDELFGVRLSHASVIRRCSELIGDKKIYQFGIRSGERAEFRWGKEHNYFHPFYLGSLDGYMSELKDMPVYFTLDLDVLDPSVFPGTGTPEPGGVSYAELEAAAVRVCSGLNIVGCDVVELCPHYDQSGASTVVACKILREMLLALGENIRYNKFK